MTDIDPSTETGVANTVVPYFDINFFNFHELFLQDSDKEPLQKQAEARLVEKPTQNSPKSIATPVREMIQALAAPFNLQEVGMQSQKDPFGVKAKSEMVIGKQQESIKRPDIPEDFIDRDMLSSSPSAKNHQSPTHPLDSPEREDEKPKDLEEVPTIQNVASQGKRKFSENEPPGLSLRKEKSSIEGNKRPMHQTFIERGSACHEDLGRRNSGKKSFTTFESMRSFREDAKEAFRPKVNLPKMLVRIQSSEDVVDTLPEGFDPENCSTDLKSSLLGSFRPPPSVRSGLHITVGNLALIFALTKNMQKKDRFTSVKPFDERISLLKKIFGLHDVSGSILEVKNQSLSKLGRDF